MAKLLACCELGLAPSSPQAVSSPLTATFDIFWSRHWLFVQQILLDLWLAASSTLLARLPVLFAVIVTNVSSFEPDS